MNGHVHKQLQAYVSVCSSAAAHAADLGVSPVALCNRASTFECRTAISTTNSSVDALRVNGIFLHCIIETRVSFLKHETREEVATKPTKGYKIVGVVLRGFAL